MSDPEKIRIRPLDDQSDYALWRIRVLAHIDAKGYVSVFERTFEDDSAIANRRHASNIIVNTLSDQALRVVRGVIGNPSDMMEKLDSRYDSKTTASRIAKMSELVGTRFTNLNADMSAHVDKMAGLIEQLRSMGTTFDDSLAIGMLVASIEVSELFAVTASIKTLSADSVNWEQVSNRLIEETKTITSGSRGIIRASAANSSCQICQKKHPTEKCFLNPMNPNCKLDVSASDVSNVLENKAPRASENNRRNRKRGDGNRAERSAMARGMNNSRVVDRIMIDSGTTSHITPLPESVQDKVPSNRPITLADESTMHSAFIGIRKIDLQTDDGPQRLSLSNTLVVPDAGLSLLSVPALVKKDIGVLFMPEYAILIDLKDNLAILGYAEQDQDGLFYLNDDGSTGPPVKRAVSVQQLRSMMAAVDRHFGSRSNTDRNIAATDKDFVQNANNPADTSNSVQAKMPSSVTEKNETVQTWHLRLGHSLPIKAVRRHVKDGILPHISCKVIDCEVCHSGKFKRRFGGSLTSAEEVGTIHVDTKGQLETESTRGHKYFVTMIEEYSRFVSVRPIKSKGEAASEVLKFIRFFEKQSGRVVKKVHTDGGTEFLRSLSELERQGVDISTTVPYTPESNGLAERTHQTVVANARTCLHQAKLPLKFWNFAVSHVVDCRNYIRHDTTKKIPFEVVFGRRPRNVSHLRPFGCRMTFRPSVKKLDAFEPRAQNGICLYHQGGGVYDVFDGRYVVRTKHVLAREREFPGLSLFSEQPSQVDEEDEEWEIEEVSADEQYPEQGGMLSSPSDPISHNDPDALTHTPAEPSRLGESSASGEDSEADPTFHDASADITPPSGPYQLRPRRQVDYSCTASVKIVDEPDQPKLSVALKSTQSDEWIQSINDEFDIVTKNKTWVHVGQSQQPPNAEVLPSGVVLRIKRNAHGQISRLKARLVVRGNFQEDAVDYAELYAPVACVELVRLMLAVAVQKNYTISQVDIKGAFLHAKLPENDHIWVRLPKIDGVSAANGQIVKLVKSLYGLRQAPKLWYKLLAETLSKAGFRRSKYSDCLFIGGSTSRPVYIVAYVDDLLVLGAHTTVESAKESIGKLLSVSDLGACSFFLGVKMEKRPEGLFLSQSAYATRILDAAKMSDCKPTSTPLPLAHPLYRERKPATDDERRDMSSVPYRSVLGSLIYLSTRTRPDIATAVSLLGKYQADPTPTDWKALKHLLRYIKGTVDYGIVLPSHDNSALTAYSDADWARDESTRRSRSGILITFAGAPIVWQSKLQQATATSTAEAEFAALSTCAREVGWLRGVLAELHLQDDSPTTVLQDNLGTITWTQDVQGLRRVKHVGLRYHFVREMVDNMAIKVVYVPSDKNKADSLTKVLGPQLHAMHRQFLAVTK